jgi:hypothetical protein
LSSKKENLALVGVGAAACAVCCAGPIIGFFTAVGLGTLIGVVLFGSIGIAIAAIGSIVVLGRRRRRTNACSTANDQAVVLVQRP